MAVYTVIDKHLLEGFLARFELGALRHFEGIAAGVENTNYFVTTSGSGAPADGSECRELVLTLFERLAQTELAFHIELLDLLACAGLPVPRPLRDRDGRALQVLAGKPALLMPRLPGHHPQVPGIAHCSAIGRALGQMHRHTLAWGRHHQGYRNLDWLAQTGERMLAYLAPSEASVLRDELVRLGELRRRPDLPQSIIHGDLFRDNALFESVVLAGSDALPGGERLSGIIDFFSAGTGYLLLDLAIVANDWCVMPDGSLDARRHLALLQSYSEQRTPAAAECAAWGDFLRVAALRFWVSRLEDAHQPPQLATGALPHVKDPEAYRALLLHRRDHPTPWPVPPRSR